MLDLIPWRENRGLSQLRREMDHLFDRFFEGWPFRSREGGEWLPAVDVSEKAREIIVKAELPGMDPNEIDISLNGNLLNIRGERKQEKEEQDESFHRIERSYGAFSRTLTLPADVDPDGVKATYKDGVLKIEMPKTKESEGKKIEVKKE